MWQADYRKGGWSDWEEVQLTWFIFLHFVIEGNEGCGLSLHPLFLSFLRVS